VRCLRGDEILDALVEDFISPEAPHRAGLGGGEKKPLRLRRNLECRPLFYFERASRGCDNDAMSAVLFLALI